MPEIIMLTVSGFINEGIEQRNYLYICDNLCDTIYFYIEGNKTLLDKNYYSSYNCCF